MLVLVGLGVQRLAELAHALAQRACQLGQALGAEHHQGDGAEEQQMDGTLDSHSLQASAPRAHRRSPPLHCEGSAPRTNTLAGTTHRRPGSYSRSVALEPSAAPGRPYPPPPAAEPFWPAQLTVLAAIGLQLLLPSRLTVGPPALVPGLEAVLFVGMFLATPNQLEHEHPRRRRLALSLTAFVSAANVYSLGALTYYLLHNGVANGRELITAGVLIWLTNFLIFALWYWEIDRGGPGRRAAGQDGAPDFLYPQMSDDRIEPREWRPKFMDYLYVSLTNATAFSPTDTMPLTGIAKGTMGIQALVSLVTIGLIVSRAVNILAA